ncbi:Mce protein [Nocardia sp. CC201C]|uniref:Mce protein n=1 Tax=Nocardia sp. CC201C TaxID=3044575 RepID=UPI0024A7D230|nr:Mce protein [Nocardia sp. CC201C]
MAKTIRIRWRPAAGARRLAPAIALLLIIGLGAAAAYFGWQYREVRATEQASAAALRAAETYAVTLTSVDSADLDANFQAVLDGSTGEFRDAYTQSSSQLRQLLIDHRAAGKGVVLQSAVQSATRDEVVVLLFVDQTVTNTEMPDPRVDRSRIVMTMRLVDGQWKAARVDIP